jgi:hypothetical protein
MALPPLSSEIEALYQMIVHFQDLLDILGDSLPAEEGQYPLFVAGCWLSRPLRKVLPCLPIQKNNSPQKNAPPKSTSTAA